MLYRWIQWLFTYVQNAFKNKKGEIWHHQSEFGNTEAILCDIQ